MSRPKIDRQAVYDKAQGKCGYCGCDLTLKTMQVDHIRPQAYFATRPWTGSKPDYNVHDPQNLMAACRRCNKWKSVLSVDQFRHEIIMQVERLNRDSANYRLAKDFGLIDETSRGVYFYFERLKG